MENNFWMLGKLVKAFEHGDEVGQGSIVALTEDRNGGIVVFIKDGEGFVFRTGLDNCRFV